MRPHFRFEDLEIWQLALALAVEFHRLAEKLDGDLRLLLPGEADELLSDCDRLSCKITNFSRSLAP
jgi:hypothetical protein